jgi:branched-chain amino acid transport system ATP-binding protein
MNETALETRALCKHFGALQVAGDIEISLKRGARHALIGPNGAGKTSFVNLVTGVLRPSSGRILLDGQDITSLPQAQRVKRGIVRTFQITSLFRGLTVLENVVLAVTERRGAAGGMFRAAGRKRDLIDESYELLRQLGIEQDALLPVKRLPYGRQRMVEIAVALGLSPKVLLLDEPAAGVPSTDSGIIVETVERLPADIAVLIIEHDLDLVFRLARRITVLVSGRVLVEGTPEAIAADPRVREVYLGERAPS